MYRRKDGTKTFSLKPHVRMGVQILRQGFSTTNFLFYFLLLGTCFLAMMFFFTLNGFAAGDLQNAYSVLSIVLSVLSLVVTALISIKRH
jgi:hypothetical protein